MKNNFFKKWTCPSRRKKRNIHLSKVNVQQAAPSQSATKQDAKKSEQRTSRCLGKAFQKGDEACRQSVLGVRGKNRRKIIVLGGQRREKHASDIKSINSSKMQDCSPLPFTSLLALWLPETLGFSLIFPYFQMSSHILSCCHIVFLQMLPTSLAPLPHMPVQPHQKESEVIGSIHWAYRY